MSLLMEALKRAEAAKRQAGEARFDGVPPPAPSASSAEEPFLAQHSATEATTPEHSPASPLALEPMPGESVAAKKNVPDGQQPPLGASRDTREQSAARNVFTAKQPTQTNKSNKALWAITGLGALIALMLGAYFWWQLQALPGKNLTLASTTASAPRPSAPSAQARPLDSQLPAPPSQSVLPPERMAAPTVSAPRAATGPERAKPAESSLQLPPAPLPDRPPRMESRPSQRNTPLPAAEGNSPYVQFSRSHPKTDTLTERAYDALQSGRLDEARHNYEQVLRSDVRNTDALLGLATIAARQGQNAQAYAYYVRALESDPNDPTAKAGIISTQGQNDSDRSESRLKTALASQPDSSALLFALGNLYARQERWSEAQQVFFRTYSTDPENPDFLFNLAVSLDHLRQNKLAAQYYQMALNAAEKKAASFDREQTRKRLLELQP